MSSNWRLCMSNVLKCKMCGGDLDVTVSDIATCQYCGSKQILPKLTSEKKSNLYDRADHYRSQNDFDKAAAIYEQALLEDDSDAEIYWDIVLCKYGVEYVEDPATHKRIPTVNRTQFKSIIDDENYRHALKYASADQKAVIEESAKAIDEIQKGILDISRREQPYDVFICYKETDDSGRRTEDSVIAQDIYKELVKEGYKVFFARISLEDKIGSAYEPYIFAALNSAKVMVAIGSRREYFNAVWVKNEWSRYIGMISSGERKTLIPVYKNMDPYDLPDEFSYLQGQDMGKIGAMQDLIHGIEKLIKPDVVSLNASNNAVDTYAQKKRIQLFLDNKDYKNANNYADKLLDMIPEDGEAHLLKFCAEVGIKNISELSEAKKSFDNVVSYQNVIRFSSSSTKEELETYLRRVKDLEAKRQKKTVRAIVASAIVVGIIAVAAYMIPNVIAPQIRLKSEYSEAEKQLANGEYEKAYDSFDALGNYKDSSDKKLEVRYQQVEELIVSKKYDEASNMLDVFETNAKTNGHIAELREKILESKYNDALALYQNGDNTKAKAIFETISDYKDAETYICECDYMDICNAFENGRYTSVVNSIIGRNLYGYKDCAEILEKAASMNGHSSYSWTSRVRQNVKYFGEKDFHITAFENNDEDNINPANKIDYNYYHYYHIKVDGGEKGEKHSITYYVSIGNDIYSNTVSVEKGDYVDCTCYTEIPLVTSSYAIVIDEDGTVLDSFSKKYRR